MPHRSRVPVLFVLLALAAGCATGGSPTTVVASGAPALGPSASRLVPPVAPEPAGRATIRGRVSAPDDLDEATLAGAEVVALDAAGEPLPGVEAAHVDGSGAFTLPGVPVGAAVVLRTRLADAEGEVRELETLVHVDRGELDADLDAATTVATSEARRGGVVARLGRGAFDATVAEVRQDLKKALAALERRRTDLASDLKEPRPDPSPSAKPGRRSQQPGLRKR